MSLISDAKPVTDSLYSCQSPCQKIHTAETRVELWPYPGLESRVFSLCLNAADTLKQQQVTTVILRHCNGVCVPYSVLLLQSLWEQFRVGLSLFEPSESPLLTLMRSQQLDLLAGSSRV